MFFRDSQGLLERNYKHGSISIEKTYRFQEILTLKHKSKTANGKSVTDASIWVMFISKNSDTLDIADHSLFNSPIINRRCGFHSRSTDLAEKHHS